MHEPPRTVSIGGATYDLFLELPTLMHGVEDTGRVSFGIGEKINVDAVIETCGGGASNTSVGLSRLGCSASFAGVVGADQWGERLLKNLEHEGVDVSGATIVEGETSSFSLILLLPSGERTLLYHRGASEHLEDTTFDRDALVQANAVYLNHLCERSCMIEDDIVLMLQANVSAHLTWNPGGEQITAGMHGKETAGLLKRTQFLLLNKEEAQAFTGENETKNALRVLRQAGAQNICITDGKNGTYGTDEHGSYFCPAMTNMRVIDATGAGDAFGTGVTWGLLHGKSLPESMIAGTLNASSVVQKMGAQAGLLTENALETELSHHALTVDHLHW